MRSLEAAGPQTSGGTTYEFVSWSDGGAATHNDQHAGREHDLHRDVSSPAAAGRASGCPRPTSTTWTSPGRRVTRIDPTVDFDWGTGSPAAAIGADTFSVRWTGQVQAPFSGTYTFYTVSDDGVRLWVNGAAGESLDRPRRRPSTAARSR